MFSASIIIMGMVLAAPTVVVDHDVVEYHFPEGSIPFRSNGDVRAVRLFVSEDSGLTWKFVEERQSTELWFKFKATKDGILWFAVQSVLEDGAKLPSDTRFLRPALKIYVNQERRTLIHRAEPKMQPQEKK